MASLLVGAVGGLRRNRLKGLMTFRGMMNRGFMVALVLYGNVWLVVLYVGRYCLMRYGVLGVANGVMRGTRRRVRWFKGIGVWRGMAVGLRIMRLVGLPPFLGFFAKVYAIAEGYNRG